MKLIFDPKPVKTFAFQISFNIGWRHEPSKEKGTIRRELEELLNLILNTLPSWFDGYYHLDAEFSSLIIMGLSEDHERIPNILKVIDINFPEKLSELNSGLELLVLSGGIRKDIIDDVSEFQSNYNKTRPKIQSMPKRFVNAKGLNRVHKHFLVSTMLKKGYELFLEVSPRGDRIHYGSKMGKIIIDELDTLLKLYEHWIRRRFESTKDSAALLTLMNIYEKKIRNSEDVVKELYSLNVSYLQEAVGKLNAVIGK